MAKSRKRPTLGESRAKEKSVPRVMHTKLAPITPTDEENEKRIESLFRDSSKCVTEIKALHQCPKCQVDMTIAGWYDKSDRTLNGVVVDTRQQCHGCGAVVKPVVKEQSHDCSGSA